MRHLDVGVDLGRAARRRLRAGWVPGGRKCADRSGSAHRCGAAVGLRQSSPVALPSRARRRDLADVCVRDCLRAACGGRGPAQARRAIVLVDAFARPRRRRERHARTRERVELVEDARERTGRTTGLEGRSRCAVGERAVTGRDCPAGGASRPENRERSESGKRRRKGEREGRESTCGHKGPPWKCLRGSTPPRTPPRAFPRSGQPSLHPGEIRARARAAETRISKEGPCHLLVLEGTV